MKKNNSKKTSKNSLVSIPLLNATTNDTDFPLAQLSQEILERAKAEGLDARSLSLLLSAVIISGIAVTVFYDSNKEAGSTFAKQAHLPTALLQALFVSGSLSTNFIVNAYFSYDIPNTLIDSLRAIPWLWKQRSVMGEINHTEELTPSQIADLATKECLQLILKSIPVLASTAQMVALGIAANLPEWLLYSGLVAYVLMHWSSVTHFVENNIKAAWKKMRSYYPWQDPSITFQLLIAEQQYKILFQYNHMIQDTLYKIRLILEEELNHQKLIATQTNTDIEAIVAVSRFKTQLENIQQLINNNRAFEVQLALLNLANELDVPSKKKPGSALFGVDIVNFILLNLCYLGYDMMVYRETEKYTHYQIAANAVIAFALTFPLNYLISCIIAPSNTRKLWDLLINEHQEKSVAFQRFPTTFKILFGLLFTMAFFSFGTTVLLNSDYLPNQYVKSPLSLIFVNIISIIYNTYFNAFPLPIIVPALIVPLHLLLNAIINHILNPIINHCGYHLQDNANAINNARKDMILENFLFGLARSTQFLTRQGILKMLLTQDEDTIKLLLGNQKPKDLLEDSFFENKNWKESMTLLSDPEHVEQKNYYTAIQESSKPKIMNEPEPNERQATKTSTSTSSSWASWCSKFNIPAKTDTNTNFNNSLLTAQI